MITMKMIDQTIADGPYKDNWDSLAGHPEPKWFRDAKFGIFIHWGVYSVPAFGSEWYPRNMYIRNSPEYEHHIRTYGLHKDFGYKDFIPLFQAEKFDPEAWAELFRSSGAKYVVPVAEHHDGFQMYRSSLSHWNAAEMGPCRNILGELDDACRKAGLTVGASSHRAEHWFFMGHGKEFDSDIREPLKKEDLYWPAMPEADHMDLHSSPAPSKEFLEDWLLRTCELVQEYQPRLIYFDWWIRHETFRPYLKKFAAFYYNLAEKWQQEVLICYKHDGFLFGTAVPDVERGQFASMKPYCWQSDTSVALNSWGYTEGNRYRTGAEILRDMIDIVSKNGCLLLNIGPKADGTIPEEDSRILKEIGAWLSRNGEAIYGTRPWKIFGEGPTEVTEGFFTDDIKKEFTSSDIRYTRRGSSLYAIFMQPSGDGQYCMPALAEKNEKEKPVFQGLIRAVETLGDMTITGTYRDENGLHVSTDGIGNSDDALPVVFRVTLE